MYEGNPVLKPGIWPDERGFAMPYSDGVWFDPADQLFKMWYYGGVRNGSSYAYSVDGKAWIRPSLEDATTRRTNRVVVYGGGRDSTTIWLDLEEERVSRRYKAFAYAGGQHLKVYYSPDGLNWTRDEENTIPSLSDRTTVFWNPFRKVWVESMRGKVRLPASGSHPKRYVRARFYSESSDLKNWTPQDRQETYWVGPDIKDLPYDGTEVRPELYNLDAVAYESLIVGLFSWFYPPPGPDLVELGVGFSRDGFHWSRPLRSEGGSSFVPASRDLSSWNGFNTQSAGGGLLVVGDELWFYLAGRNGPHSVSGDDREINWSTGLARMRRDGFVSMDADESGGQLTTRLLRFSGQYLFTNVDAPRGSMTVAVLDTDGKEIYPFTRERSEVIREDGTRLQVRWKGATNLSCLAGRPVRFRFFLENGSLYSFWVANLTSGASNGYIAAGGPGFRGPRDLIGDGSSTVMGEPESCESSEITPARPSNR
jgi:hypothetical protein